MAAENLALSSQENITHFNILKKYENRRIILNRNTFSTKVQLLSYKCRLEYETFNKNLLKRFNDRKLLNSSVNGSEYCTKTSPLQNQAINTNVYTRTDSV